MKRRLKEKKARPAPDPMAPNAAEVAMYLAGDEFRGPAVKLHARRAMVDECHAEQRIREHMTKLGMSPEPGNHPTPLYEKAN